MQDAEGGDVGTGDSNNGIRRPADDIGPNERSILKRITMPAVALPGPHRDPFDRMLMAQSLATRYPIITGDPVFSEYGVSVLW